MYLYNDQEWRGKDDDLSFGYFGVFQYLLGVWVYILFFFCLWVVGWQGVGELENKCFFILGFLLYVYIMYVIFRF